MHAAAAMLGSPCRLLLFVLLFAEPGFGQPRSWPPDRQGWSLNPFFQTSTVFEDNVLFSDPKVDALFLRLTPGVEAYYRGRLRTFHAGYTFDSEAYPERLASLEDAFARQYAFAELRSFWSRRSRFVLASSFLSTTRPEEVVSDTGFIPLRRRARSIATNAEFHRLLTRRLSWQAGYAFSLREFERPDPRIPVLGSVLHAFTTGVTFHHSRRTSSSFAYRARLLIQDDVAGVFLPNDFTSQILTYQWSMELSQKSRLTLAVGPRFSDGGLPELQSDGSVARRSDVEPEIRATWSYSDLRRDFSLDYAQSQYQSLGPGGFVDTESLAFSAIFTPSRKLRLELNPALYRNHRGGTTTNSAQAYFAASYRVSAWASLQSSYLMLYQDAGTFVIDGTDRPIGDATSRNTVLFGLRLSRVDDRN